MDKVLIVDDDVDLLNILEEGLQKYRGQFEVLTALDGQEALSILRRETISVLVTDLIMPKVDGVELLAHMTRNHPTTPCIVMTEHGSPKVRKRGDGADVLRYIEKPFDFNELGGAIIGELNRMDEGGFLAGVSVSDFLQLIEIEQKTCRLEVRCRDEGKGHFHFDRGVLHDAHFEDLRGEDAATRMIGWDHVDVRLRSPSRKNVKRRISRELISLIGANA
jgi:DNA-binding response OmpR family regulator